jgi:hypothetical protein
MRNAAAAALAALVLTLAMAWPVVMAPSTRIYGGAIDGRHHDPFTVMWQFEHAAPRFPYRQPLVDDVGRVLQRAMGPVAAYNAIVLASFPLTAFAAFVLARYLKLSTGASAVAAFAFAFAPPHLAHAAYHPHIAQTQWLPLYFLALWACAARLSASRMLLFAAAALALALSNLYSAFIAAVITPVAAAGAWAWQRPGRPRQSALVLIATAGAIAATVAAVHLAAPGLFSTSSALAFPRADLARYGAQTAAYFVPPVDHPLWGARAAAYWASRRMTGAVLEQQLSLSWALLALAGVALWHWRRHARAGSPVPLLAAVAIAAFACSLAPPPGSGTLAWLVPAAWLHEAAPMFRAYARFAFVTHLMIALLAGIGTMCLWRDARFRGARVLACALLAIAALEYLPFPARSRDVLPTAAHRWLATRPASMHVLDCVAATRDEALVSWLMKRSLSTLSPALSSCADPNAAQQAATLGYTYLIDRAHTAWPRLTSTPPGFALVRRFDAADVYEIVAAPSRVVLARTDGFGKTEQNAGGSWRWMGQQASWDVRVAGDGTADVTLDLDVAAFGMPRTMTIDLDGTPAGQLHAGIEGARHRLGPWAFQPGVHRLTFTAVEPASAAPPPDRRRLTFMFRGWRWEPVASQRVE